MKEEWKNVKRLKDRDEVGKNEKDMNNRMKEE